MDANLKEEAIELIKNNDYDDIFDTSLEEEYNDTIKIKEDKEETDINVGEVQE